MFINEACQKCVAATIILPLIPFHSILISFLYSFFIFLLSLFTWISLILFSMSPRFHSTPPLKKIGGGPVAHRLAPVINAVRVGRLGSALICSFFLHVTYIYSAGYLALYSLSCWRETNFPTQHPQKKLFLANNIVIYYNFVV